VPSESLPIDDRVARLLARRDGHFRLESGHHGDLWLDLEKLCLRPEPVRRLAVELARRLAPYRIEAVCGPLVEGAFVALFVAHELCVPFTYAQLLVEETSDSLFPARYRIPSALRGELAGKRVAIVSDVVNAGSAVRATLADLASCGAHPIALGTLAVLGKKAAELAAGAGLELETVAEFPNTIWEPGGVSAVRARRSSGLSGSVGPAGFDDGELHESGAVRRPLRMG
jgi:orotate phosphoribosyltransferase